MSRPAFRVSLRSTLAVAGLVIVVVGLVSAPIRVWLRAESLGASLRSAKASVGMTGARIDSIQITGPLTPETVGLISQCVDLTRLRVHGGAFDQEMCAALQGMPRLSYVAAVDCHVSWPALAEVLDGSRVVELELIGSRIDYEAIQLLPGRLSKLEDVNLNGTTIGDEFLVQVQGSPSLRRLALLGTHVTGQGIVSLGRLPSLEYLSFAGFCDDNVGCLAQFPALTLVDLSGNGISDRAIERLPRSDALVILHLAETQVTDQGVALCVQKFPRLEALQLSGTQITGECFGALATLPSLHSLGLIRTPIQSAHLVQLGKAPALMQVSMQGTAVGDEATPTLSGCRHLRTLWISGTRVTAAGLKELGKALPTTVIE